MHNFIEGVQEIGRKAFSSGCKGCGQDASASLIRTKFCFTGTRMRFGLHENFPTSCRLSPVRQGKLLFSCQTEMRVVVARLITFLKTVCYHHPITSLLIASYAGVVRAVAVNLRKVFADEK